MESRCTLSITQGTIITIILSADSTQYREIGIFDSQQYHHAVVDALWSRAAMNICVHTIRISMKSTCSNNRMSKDINKKEAGTRN